MLLLYCETCCFCISKLPAYTSECSVDTNSQSRLSQLLRTGMPNCVHKFSQLCLHEIKDAFVPFLIEQVYADGVLPSAPDSVTIYHSREEPEISIGDYIHRFCRYTKCTNEVLICAVIYLTRAVEPVCGACLDVLSIHRFVFCALMAAFKFHEDQMLLAMHKIAGLPSNELLQLELHFLFSIRFRLYVSKDEFELFEKQLMNKLAVKCC